MKKQILLSILVISTVIALVSGATLAFFSDKEVASGNTFTAGELDLKVDNECYFNGKKCICEPYPNCHWENSQESCTCTWPLTDLVNEKFFDFNDVKPGHHGEDTISFHIANDAWVCAAVYNVKNYEYGCNEPEALVDKSCGDTGEGQGELQNHLFFTIWRDYDCDNKRDDDEPVLVDKHLARNGVWPIADSTTGTGALPAGENCIGVSWFVSSNAGNDVQSDSLKGDIKFWAEQAVNRPDFECVHREHYPESGNAYIGYEDWTDGDFDYNDFGMTFSTEEIYNPDLDLAEVTMIFKAVVYDSGMDHLIHIKRPFNGGYTYTVTRSVPAYPNVLTLWDGATGKETPDGTYIGTGPLDVTLFNTAKYNFPQKPPNMGEVVTVHVYLDDPELNPKQVLTPPRSYSNGTTFYDMAPIMANYDPWEEGTLYKCRFHIQDTQVISDTSSQKYYPAGEVIPVGTKTPLILVVPYKDWIPPYESTTITGPYGWFNDFYTTGLPENWYHPTMVTNNVVGQGGLSWGPYS